MSGVIAALVTSAILSLLDKLSGLSLADFVLYVALPVMLIVIAVVTGTVMLGINQAFDTSEKRQEQIQAHGEAIEDHTKAIEELQRLVADLQAALSRE